MKILFTISATKSAQEYVMVRSKCTNAITSFEPNFARATLRYRAKNCSIVIISDDLLYNKLNYHVYRETLLKKKLKKRILVIS